MPTSVYDYSKSQLTSQYVGNSSSKYADDLEMGVGNPDNPLYSINNHSQDFSEDGEEMDIESQRPYPTSTFFSNNETSHTSQPQFTSTAAGVTPTPKPQIKV